MNVEKFGKWKYPLKIGFILGIIFALIYLINILINPPGVNFFGNYIVGIPQTFLHGFIMGFVITIILYFISKRGKSYSSKGGIIGLTSSILLIVSVFALPYRVSNKYITRFFTNYFFEAWYYSFIFWAIWLLLGFIIGYFIGKYYQNNSKI